MPAAGSTTTAGDSGGAAAVAVNGGTGCAAAVELCAGGGVASAPEGSQRAPQNTALRASQHDWATAIRSDASQHP
jgi:hypothetical protein